jgi:serine protease inhibitor
MRVARPPYAGDESVLAVANRLWVDEHSTPRATFTQSLSAWPGAEIRSVGIVRDPEAARKAMNQDVAVTTKGLIPRILPEGSLTPDDRAVLINAIYLLAGWLERFSPDRTGLERFSAASGDREVPMMRGSREANYAANGGWAYVRLSLWLGMDAEVLLPPPADHPHSARLKLETLFGLRGAATGHRVDLHLPRFRLSTSVDLDPAHADLFGPQNRAFLAKDRARAAQPLSRPSDLGSSPCAQGSPTRGAPRRRHGLDRHGIRLHEGRRGALPPAVPFLRLQAPREAGGAAGH